MSTRVYARSAPSTFVISDDASKHSMQTVEPDKADERDFEKFKEQYSKAYHKLRELLKG